MQADGNTAIRVYGANSLISGNSVGGNGKRISAIVLAAGTTDNSIIRDNTVYGAAWSGAGYILANADEVLIEGNDLSGNSDGLLMQLTGARTKVYGNSLAPGHGLIDDQTTTVWKDNYLYQVTDAWVTGANHNFAASNLNTWHLRGLRRQRLLQRFARGHDGKRLTLIWHEHSVGMTMILQNENSGSTAANRILTGTRAGVTFHQPDVVELVYDGILQRWCVI